MPVFQSTRPRGARPAQPVVVKSRCGFQSTRPRGARHNGTYTPITPTGFNPRAHAGRDCEPPPSLTISTCFNPRAHAGRDKKALTDFRKAIVSIHAPTRGATAVVCRQRISLDVSIHAPTRGATMVACTISSSCVFQSTRPRGARPLRSAVVNSVLLFQSTRPRGARRTSASMPTAQKSFNPRAHAGRDLPQRHCRFLVAFVSIHAPTRGATAVADFCERCVNVSIHAPTRGATRRRSQPHDLSSVSIHAPTRGATSNAQRSCHWASFNPRAHAGRDTNSPTVIVMHIQFQSTRPRGARHRAAEAFRPQHQVSIHAPTRGATSTSNGNTFPHPCFNPRAHAGRDSCFRRVLISGFRFNPRAHAGRDAQTSNLLPQTSVSIHAPTRGATRRTSSYTCRTRCFNPRAHAGRDREIQYHGRLYLRRFNPRAHAGRDPTVNELVADGILFQSTRPRGARLESIGGSDRIYLVSIHAPTRGAT